MSTSAAPDSGSFTQSGGTNSVSSDLYLGYSAGSSGTYNLSGSGLLSAPYEYIGYSGTAASRSRAEPMRSPTLCTSDYNAGSSGTYNLSGSGLLSAAPI